MSTTITGIAGCSQVVDDSIETADLQDGSVTLIKLASDVTTDSMRMVVASDQTIGAADTYIDFVNLPTYCSQITINFSGVSTGDASSPIIQVGTSAGIEVASYLSSSSAINGSTATTASACSNGFIVNSILAANVLYGSYTLTKLDNNSWVGSGNFRINATGNAFCGGQSPILATEIQTIRITTVLGVTNLAPGGIIGITYGGPL